MALPTAALFRPKGSSSQGVLSAMNSEAMNSEAALDSQSAPRDPKRILNDLVEKQLILQPKYTSVKRNKSHHHCQVEARVIIYGIMAGKANGRTKEQAETRAAAALLLQIEMAGIWCYEEASNVDGRMVYRVNKLFPNGVVARIQ